MSGYVSGMMIIELDLVSRLGVYAIEVQNRIELNRSETSTSGDLCFNYVLLLPKKQGTHIGTTV